MKGVHLASTDKTLFALGGRGKNNIWHKPDQSAQKSGGEDVSPSRS